MSFKYSLNQLVELENGAVGMVSSREEYLSEAKETEIIYEVDFLNRTELTFEENELKKTCKKVITTREGKSKEQLDEAKKLLQEKEAKQARITRAMKNINRYKPEHFATPEIFGSAILEAAENTLRYELYGENPIERNENEAINNSISKNYFSTFPMYTYGTKVTFDN